VNYREKGCGGQPLGWAGFLTPLVFEKCWWGKSCYYSNHMRCLKKSIPRPFRPGSRQQSCLGIFVLLTLFCLVSLFNPSVLYAIEYGGLGIYPNATEVNATNDFTKAWFIYTLEPGEIKKGKVDVINTSVERVVAKIYPVDAVTTTDGAFAPEPEDKEKTGVGSWVTLAESEVFLKPRETKTIDFTVAVPMHAEVGDHMGAIIIQSKGPPKAVEGSGLSITTRVGARMYITVPGEIVRRLAFNKGSSFSIIRTFLTCVVMM